jgi:hypothetical protein
MPEIKPLNIRVPQDLQALFVNMVRISHTPGEFILDFSSILPGLTDPKVDARLVLSPLGFKMVTAALNENLRRFESTFGEIKVPTGGHTLADELFKGPGEPEPPQPRS